MERKVILYIAMSLDGYIADRNGGIDWLGGHGETSEVDNSYNEFIATIDTVIMGRNTYEQIVNDLSPDMWAYDGLKSYVFSSTSLTKNEKVKFINSDLCDFVDELKESDGKNIWIVGGAGLVKDLVLSNKIDEYYIAIMPIILGDGIRLFPKSNQIKLHLDKCNTINGVTLIRYSQRN